MTDHTASKLVRMANQIGAFFGHQGEGPAADEKAVAAIAQHLLDFWDPRMREGILAHLAAGGAGLDPLVKRAVERLAASKAA
jgi:formate dehydrogenase subunit delta